MNKEKKRLLAVWCLTALAFFHFFSGYAWSQPANDHTVPISSIDVKGLYSIPREELLYLLNLSEGKPLDRNDLRKGIKRAFLKGIFDDIIVESVDKSGAALRVTAREKRIIRYIKVNGNSHFSNRFVKKRSGIKTDERLSMLKLNNAAAGLKKEMGLRGFTGATVFFETVPSGKNGAGVVININEGQPEIINNIKITSQDDFIKEELALSVNDVYDSTKMESLVKKAARRYKNEGFIGASLRYSFHNGTLDIEFDPGTKLNISFNGNTALSAKILMKEIQFFEINEFSEDLLEETAARITSLYHTYGYPFAQIAPVKSLTDEGLNIEFFVFEGDRYKIASIEFEGVYMPEDRLEKILTMRKGDYYNPELMDANIENLIEFYRALGYIYMEILEPEIRMNQNNVEIKFFVDEGPQVKLGKISIKGSKNISEKEIMKGISLNPGQPYNEVDISDSARKIMELYNKSGFIDASVITEREISGTSASVSFIVHEGEKALFGKAVIAGNEQTKSRVIRRDFLHAYDKPFDFGMLMKERQRLYRLGLFTDLEIIPLDKEDGRKDILYKVKEASAGAVEFGIGYGEYEKYRGFIDISYKNLFGMNRQGSFRTELSTLEQRYILSYYEPRLFDTDFIFRSLLMHEKRKEENIDTGETRYRLTRNNFTAGIEKKLSEKFKAELYYDFSVVKTSDVKPDVVLSREDTGTLIISAVRPGLIYDTRDNPFEPTEGVLAGLSFKIASAALFSETDFLKASFYVNKYQSLHKRVVLAASLRGGAAKGFVDTRELPIVERFFLGGRTTVRGYEQDTLGPKGSDGTPTGGNAFVMGNLELRTNIGRDIGFVAFVDAGNVWRKIEQAEISDIKYTSGIGLRYNTPVGPFRIDYGHELNRERGESKGEVHFSLGHAF